MSAPPTSAMTQNQPSAAIKALVSGLVAYAVGGCSVNTWYCTRGATADQIVPAASPITALPTTIRTAASSARPVGGPGRASAVRGEAGLPGGGSMLLSVIAL